MGNGFGPVDRAVSSNTRGPRFESSHRQNLYWTLFSVNCIEKTKIKGLKRPIKTFGILFTTLVGRWSFQKDISEFKVCKLLVFTIWWADIVTFFKKMGQPRHLFRLFFVFSNKHYNFYKKYMWKNVHLVYSAEIWTHDLWCH